MGGEMDRLFETYKSSKMKFEIIRDLIYWYNEIRFHSVFDDLTKNI
jgi:hypothetical protein